MPKLEREREMRRRLLHNPVCTRVVPSLTPPKKKKDGLPFDPPDLLPAVLPGDSKKGTRLVCFFLRTLLTKVDLATFFWGGGGQNFIYFRVLKFLFFLVKQNVAALPLLACWP